MTTTNNAINGPVPWRFEKVVSPPGNIVNMRPYVTYFTSETVIGNMVTFIVPSSDNVNIGDEFRVTCAGDAAVGFRITGNGDDKFWVSLYNGLSNNGNILAVFASGGAGTVTASVHIGCFDNSDPAFAQFQVWSNNGAVDAGTTPS